MNIGIDILSSILLLLPGFVIVRIIQSTSEYKDVSVFEYTITSIGFSIFILSSWLLFNSILESIPSLNYSFFQELKEVVINKNMEIIFSNFTLKFIFSYVNVVCIFSCLFYNIYYSKIIFKIKGILGHSRFSDHLTPWEDFLILNINNWVVIDLSDGRTILGKVAFFSHSPFPKELVIKRVDDSPVEIYDADKKKVDFGPDISQSYIKYDEITAIHAIEDKKIQEIPIRILDYCFVLITFVIFFVICTTFFILLIFKASNIYSFSFLAIILMFIALIISVIWNLLSLKSFS